MGSIFSSKGLTAMLALVMLALSGCAEREPNVIVPPKEATAVIEPFLVALARGDKAKAISFVDVSALDEMDEQFANDFKKLSKAGKVTPRYIYIPKTPVFGADIDKIDLVYAAKNKGIWTTVTVRAYRLPGKPYVINYWRVSNKVPNNPQQLNADDKVTKQAEEVQNIAIAAMAALGLCGILLLVWLLLKKPHLLAPTEVAETRRAATTSRDGDI